jgi:hypothetical protein
MQLLDLQKGLRLILVHFLDYQQVTFFGRLAGAAGRYCGRRDMCA